jgi:hypothetical protein
MHGSFGTPFINFFGELDLKIGEAIGFVSNVYTDQCAVTTDCSTDCSDLCGTECTCGNKACCGPGQ